MMSSDDVVKKNLRSAAMEDRWYDVLRMYEENRELSTEKITPTGDTGLHKAASRGEVYIVERMVDLVSEKENKNNNEKNGDTPSGVDESGDHKKLVLGIENQKGNTALHLAASASKGSVQMCMKIGGAEPSLITKRNKLGETPLFMAAKHGNRDSFLWLHYSSPQDSPSPDGDDLYKAKNNDTILHCALEGGHIDLAIEIVLLYKQHLDKMIKRNQNGLSPLHILAATPSAFQSTDLPYRSYVVQLIYHFLTVKKKEKPTSREKSKQQREHVPWLIMLSSACKFRSWFRMIRKMKEKHTWTLQLMEELLPKASYEDIAAKPYKEDTEAGLKIVDTPLMIAAKNGVKEMVESILKLFSSNMNPMNVVDDQGKNIVLLSAEKRQTKLYQFLWEFDSDNDAFGKMDNYGNTALHLAAKAGINLRGQTTTMVECKWFEYVKNSVPRELREKYNKDGRRADEIFGESYKEHMTSDREWLNQTSQTCSVASTIVASMAFSNIGGENFKEKNYSSVLALSLSLTSTICFLAIVAFRSESLNFWRYAPLMLQLAILTMFGSIFAFWISLMLHGISLATYAILGSPIAILTIVSLPIFIDPALMSMFKKFPPRNRDTTSALQYPKP